MPLTVLAVIPARGGSKGIPRKNIALLAGKPLLAWTAGAAQKARSLTRVVLSTDDEEIAGIGRDCGLEVPFTRPRELAGDATPTLPVVQHAVRFVEAQGQRYDAVCVLQPTSPMRKPQDIDGCVSLLERTGVDAVVSVCAVPPQYNPHWVYFRDSDGCLRISTGELTPIARRQDLPPAYHREGSVYVTMRDVLMEQNSLYGARVAGYLMDEAATVNIDSPADLERAAALAAGQP
jgi:CMP-N,N'-diacetyllegionaminic acid synthase